MQADEKCRNRRETQATLKTNQETPAIAISVSKKDDAERTRMTPLLTGNQSTVTGWKPGIPRRNVPLVGEKVDYFPGRGNRRSKEARSIRPWLSIT